MMIDCSNMNENNPGNYFSPTMQSQQQPNGCQTYRSGSNVKSNEATALSLTAQPFVPKQVMDIARPMPMNNNSTSRRSKESNNNNANNYGQEYGTYKSMQFQQQQHQPCTCCCNGNSMAIGVDAFLQEPMQQLHIGTPLQTERGRSIDPHRFSQMLTPGLIFESHGSHFPTYNNVSNNTGSHQRSRSAWRTNAQREMDNASPMTNGKTINQRNSFISQGNPTTTNNNNTSLFSPMINGTGQFQCLSPSSCTIHSSNNNNNGHLNGQTQQVNGLPVHMIFQHQQADGQHGCHRSRSYEFLDQANNIPVNNVVMMGRQGQHMTQGAYNIMHPSMKSQKAPLPPASHHSPEQRTSYRQ